MSSLIKEKQGSTTKGLFCADGSTPRAYIKKEDATSPTAHNKLVLITLAITSHEQCKQYVFDVMGTFLTTDGDEDVIIQLKGTLDVLMFKVDLGLYPKFTTNNSKGKPVLYVKIHKLLYGLL